MVTDEVLLHRYTQAGDAAAFRELADRYAGMVYGIGLRVTGDQHTAEDVCQECFLEFARKARTVRENVAGWLHVSATSRSLNVVRSRRRRTCREKVVARDAIAATESSEWSELEPLIDRALNGLSDDLRLPIILHYLQGESQQQVAERLGIDQATVSRRLQRGVERLRRRLGSFGVMTTVVAVTSLFGQSSAQAASSSLTAALAKIGVGGVGVTVAKSTPGSLLPSGVTLGALGAVVGYVLLALLVQGWVLLLVVVTVFALLMRPPAWVRELLRAQAFGRDLAAHPMYPFRRWTWTIPPADWKQQLFVWSYVGFTFGVVAFGVPAKSLLPGFFVAFVLMATLFLGLAVRLAWHVWTLRKRPPAADHPPQQVDQWSSWETIAGASAGAVIAAMSLLSIPREVIFALSTGTVLVWSWFVACAGMAVWALIDRRRKPYRGDASFNKTVSGVDNVDTKPVARRYHVAIIGCLTLMVVAFLFPAIVQLVIMPERPAPREPDDVYRYTKDGTRVLVERPEAFKPPPPPKGFPSIPAMTAGMGLIFSLLLLRRVVKVWDQLPRSAWLPLLAFSVLAVSLGTGMTAYAMWTAETGPRERATALSPANSQRRQPVFQPSPYHLELIRKYAVETAVITVPDEQLPEGWYLFRYDNGFECPIPNEGLHREAAIKVGLSDVPELESVDASLCRLYMNPFVLGEVDAVCAVYAFCCGNADEARRLNIAWDHRGLLKDRLVIFIFGRKGLRAPSLTDQAPIPSLFKHIQQTPPTLDSKKRPIPVRTP